MQVKLFIRNNVMVYDLAENIYYVLEYVIFQMLRNNSPKKLLDTQFIQVIREISTQTLHCLSVRATKLQQNQSQLLRT